MNDKETAVRLSLTYTHVCVYMCVDNLNFVNFTMKQIPRNFTHLFYVESIEYYILSIEYSIEYLN